MKCEGVEASQEALLQMGLALDAAARVYESVK